MQLLVYICLLILPVTIGIATERTIQNLIPTQGNGVIKKVEHSSCKTYENKFGNCTTKIRRCTENLFHKKNLTRSEYRKIIKSKCGNENEFAVCCSTQKWRIQTQKRLLLPNSKQCGQDNPITRIANGQIADITDHPWMALLIYKHARYNTLFLCGGTLISDRYVLTAAHCLRSSEYSFMNQVRLGEWNLKTAQDCANNTNDTKCSDQPIDVDVEKIIIHNEYNVITIGNDIALLRLNTTVSFTYYIRPICLPMKYSLRCKNFSNIPLTVVGWGKTEFGIKSNVKRFTEVLSVGNRRCEDIYNVRTNKKIQINFSKQLCAGGDTRDSCEGDSGGPLLYHDEDTWTIIGIVSFGFIRCGSQGFPSVYTRVGGYIKWILNNIE